MRFQYLFGEALTSLRRNALIVAAAILAVFTSVALVFVGVIIDRIAEENVGRWRDGVRVIAFISDDLSAASTADLQQEIQAWEEVDRITYFSKAEAYEEFLELFGDRPSLLEVVNEDPSILPASLRIKPTAAEDHATVTQRLAATPGVQEVTSADQSIDSLLALADLAQTSTFFMALALGASAMVLIANTIRMAIFARRDEIGIMKLVGAGNWFVRIPFLLEGMIEGLVGALLAVAAVWIGYQVWVPLTSSLPPWVSVDLPDGFLLTRGLFMLGFGVVAGLIGSAVALRRFLRE